VLTTSALLLMTAASGAWAAGGTAAAGSDPRSRAAATKTVVSTKKFKCNGFYKSYSCETTLFLNDCKQTIRIKWNPLRLPGNIEWARSHRNWCSITWDTAEATEERKYPPEKCDQIFKVMAAGLQGLPEVKWQDAPCTHIGTPDGVLYVKQNWDNTEVTKFFHDPPKFKDLDPEAVRLEDVRGCTLHNEKERVARCPVLPQRVQSWLRRFLASVDVHLVIQNPVR
jgi:hypothetical protein